jgi:DNA polymerase-3 subunit epsilon
MTAGIYYFKNEKEDVIYIGKSKNIKSRVTTHLSSKNGPKSSKMLEAICFVDYELTGSELVALLKEAHEIKLQQPVFNRALKKKRTEFGLFTYVDRAGFLRFHIRKNDGNECPVATFSSNDEAEQNLYRWIDEFELCLRMCGLHQTASPCFQYHLKQCKGACAGEEQPESYNARANVLLKRLEFDYNNLIVIDKGRRAGEFSVVYIENGSYKGFGYFDHGDAMNTPEDFKNCIKPMLDTRDARLIISGYLKKHKPLKMIEF